MNQLRAVPIDGPGEKVSVVGSQISVEANGSFTGWPPAMSTRPFGWRTALWPSRLVASLPAAVNAPVAGSHSSA